MTYTFFIANLMIERYIIFVDVIKYSTPPPCDLLFLQYKLHFHLFIPTYAFQFSSQYVNLYHYCNLKFILSSYSLII